jgi:hypothetical protein
MWLSCKDSLYLNCCDFHNCSWNGMWCVSIHWPLIMCFNLYLACFPKPIWLMLLRENLTDRHVQKCSFVPQMEMHNGLKPLIVLGVVLHTSSIKAGRWEVWGPSSNTASWGQTGLYNETLFHWITPKIYLKTSKSPVNILYLCQILR